MEVASHRTSLRSKQRDIISILLKCNSDNDTVLQLRQQFYLAMIDGYAQEYLWDQALKVVMEAFESIPAKMQKPLRKWRVVATSKKGKDVMEGLQKLKESNNSLQARVMGVLARASTNPKLQLEAYGKAIDILKSDMERVDYLLETAQWMSSAGVPRIEIFEVLQTALDALYEQLENEVLGNGDDEDEGKDEDNTSIRSGLSQGSKRSNQSRKSTTKSVVRSVASKGKPLTYNI